MANRAAVLGADSDVYIDALSESKREKWSGTEEEYERYPRLRKQFFLTHLTSKHHFYSDKSI